MCRERWVYSPAPCFVRADCLKRVRFGLWNMSLKQVAAFDDSAARVFNEIIS
jgi:hypothetical protein